MIIKKFKKANLLVTILIGATWCFLCKSHFRARGRFTIWL